MVFLLFIDGSKLEREKFHILKIYNSFYNYTEKYANFQRQREKEWEEEISDLKWIKIIFTSECN